MPKVKAVYNECPSRLACSLFSCSLAAYCNKCHPMLFPKPQNFPPMLRIAMLRCWVYGVEQGHVRTPTDIPQLQKMRIIFTQAPLPVLSPLSVLFVLGLNPSFYFSLSLSFSFSACFPFLFSTDNVRLKGEFSNLCFSPRFLSGIGSSLLIVFGSSLVILQKRVAQLK